MWPQLSEAGNVERNQVSEQEQLIHVRSKGKGKKFGFYSKNKRMTIENFKEDIFMI